MSPEVSYYHQLLFSGSSSAVTSAVAVDSVPDLESLDLNSKMVVCHRYNIPNLEESLPKLILDKSKPKTIIFKSQIDLDRFNSEFDFSGQAYLFPYPVAHSEPAQRVSGRVLFFGGCSVEHRAHKVLEAIAGLEDQPELNWLVDGSLDSAAELLKEFSVENAQLRKLEQVSDWQEMISQGASFAIHTYFSAFGDPGPYLAMSMMSALPVVVSDMGVGSAISDTAAIKVSLGASEVKELSKAFKSFSSEEVANTYSDSASKYARELHCLMSLRDQLSVIQ